MNLPLPSGSSPAEKPPQSTKIWHAAIASFIRRIESKIASAVRLQNTSLRTSAPARRKAFAVS